MRFRSSDKLCNSSKWHGRIAAVLAMLALVVAQAGPLAARALDGGLWIEICSETGPVMMRVDLSGDEDAGDEPCPACATCPFCALFDPETAMAAEVAVYRDRAADDDVVHGPQTLIANPAQFWPDNRGPPDAQAMQQTGMRDAARAPVSRSHGGAWS